jgi:hypothetical protein
MMMMMMMMMMIYLFVGFGWLDFGKYGEDSWLGFYD